MAAILRGEIWWADLNPTIGREQSGVRPVLIISEDLFNEKSGTVIAMAITSQEQKAAYPLSFELTYDFMPKKSWVKISQIRTLSVQRIKERIGDVDFDDLEKIIIGLNQIIGKY